MIVFNSFVNIPFNIDPSMRIFVEFSIKYTIAALIAVVTLFLILGISVIKNRDLKQNFCDSNKEKGS